MKGNYRIYTGILLAAMCLAVACTDRTDIADKSQQGEIVFDPVAWSNSTKSGEDIINGSDFPDDESFDVSCALLPNKDEEGHPTYEGVQHLFVATPVTRDPNTDTWKTADRYYWPLTGGMKFMAFYPTTQVLLNERKLYSGVSVDFSNYTGIYQNYKIHHTDSEYNDITDENLKTEENLPNAKVDFMACTVTMNEISKRSSDVVPITFSHNLTQIRFKVKAEKDFSDCEFHAADHTIIDTDVALSDDTSWDHANVNHVGIWVDRIELRNIYSIGSYYTSAPNWPKGDGILRDAYRYVLLSRDSKGGEHLLYQTPGYTEYRDEHDDYSKFGARTPQAVPVKDRNGDDLAVLLIPQHLESGATLSITYTLEEENLRIYNNNGYSESDPEYKSTYVMSDYSGTISREIRLSDITPDWLIGTCYTYTIIVGLHEIVVVPEYSDWNFDGSQEAVI